MSTLDAAILSSFSMAIRPHLIFGATSFRTLASTGDVWLPIWLVWVNRGNRRGEVYRFVDHARYLDAWFETLGLTRNVVLVVHDWGSALGFYRAFRYPNQVQAITYMEAIVQPRRWEDFGPDSPFHALRSSKGEHMIMDENFFVEVMLPGGVIRKLSVQEMAAYRAPYPDRESRLPTLVWPREIPIDGEPADVVAIVERYSKWLSQAAVPKLFVIGEPGRILAAGRGREFARTWPNQREATLRGIHYLQEDSPIELGTALEAFVKSVRT